MSNENILEMQKICKSFPGVKALKNVDFSVRKGEIHALMGENGAGKSTLIKIMSGVYQKDEGTMLFEGKEINPKSTFESGKAGISTIFQELNLLPYQSVAENIFAGRYPRKNGKIDWNEMNVRAKELMQEVETDIDVTKELSSYSTAIWQMVAIVRGISLNAKLLILDEPTSSLDDTEVNILFRMMRNLKEKGISMIFVSHRLNEIFTICDRITVLKDGEYVGTENIADIDKYQLVRMMMGRELNQSSACQHEYRRFKDNDPYLCEVRNLKWKNKLHDVSFGIHKGEVLGLSGLLGSGRTETVRLIFGCDRPDAGEIYFDGKQLTMKNPHAAVKNGIAFCTEDRRGEGIFPNMSIEDNISVAHMKGVQAGLGWIDYRKKKSVALKYIEQIPIKTPSTAQHIKNLSGGNQQKVILARWLNTAPKMIILDEPTRGIDVGAKVEIEKLINEFAQNGISVLLISSELQELVRNCDRIVVLRDGTSIGELWHESISEDNIMKCIAQNEVMEG